MFGIDPRLVALFCIMFIALGIFNILMGRRRQLQMPKTTKRVPWYRQMSMLTGIEYILLALAFLLNLSIVYHWLPTSLNGIVLPVYLIILLGSGLMAGFVIYQGLTNARQRRATTQPVQSGVVSNEATVSRTDYMTREEQEEYQQKRRERRQKAAAARRRRAGKA